MILHVLDKSFKLVGVVDDYISVIWRPAYYDIGDFELYINATSEAVDLLKKDYYLVRDTDIDVDESNNVTYSNVMIIKNFVINTDVEEGDYLTVTGRELKFILNQRIVWTQTNLTGTAENGIRRLVTENAIDPTNTNRKISNLILGVSAGLTDSIEKQITGTKLDQAVIDICMAYNYGWEVYVYNSVMVLIVYKGVDRSHNQTERPYVVFSDDFDNIINSEYELNSESYANTALIGGEGEGLERIYATVGNEYSGLERYETFTDARDVSRNVDSASAITIDAVDNIVDESGEVIVDEETGEIEIPLPIYLTMLQERGREDLAELAITEGFSGEVLTEGLFTYGVDFYLGDTVTVINKYGISKNVMVLSAIESVDDSGVKLIPQFNI